MLNKYKKEHCSLQKQIKTLEKRGMVVDSPEILEVINYSHLIYKYGKYYLKDEGRSIEYKPSTKVSHLTNLYNLNKKVSSLLFEVMVDIEHIIKRTISFELSKQDPLNYLQKKFYKATGVNANKLINKLMQLNKNKKNKYEEKYLIDNNLPIWLIVDEMTFGDLRYMIKNTNIEEQVISLFKNKMSFKQIENILESINEYRNIICHADILKAKFIKNHKEYKLSEIFWFVKKYFPKNYQSIHELINNYDFTNINLDKKAFLDILDVE